MAPPVLKTSCQLIDKMLRSSPRVIISQKISKTKHGIKNKRGARGRGSPMTDVSGKEQPEFRAAKILREDLRDRQIAKGSDALRCSLTEIVDKAQKVGLADVCEELVNGPRLFREFELEFSKVRLKICGNGKMRSVGKMKVVYRVHLDPFGLNSQL